MSKTVDIRTADVQVRSVRLTRSLLKQFRVLSSVPDKWLVYTLTGKPAPKDRDPKDQVQIDPAKVVGWLDGSVREGDVSRYLLIQDNGDCYLYGYYTVGSGHVPPCKQIYVS